MLIITGKSNSGKDTIAKQLEKLGYKRIVTYTTRGMRPNEINGETYHFIKVEDFLQKHITDFFLEVKFYNVVDGIWFYGSSVESYLNSDDKTFCILTPSGLRKLQEKSINYTGFYIDVSDDVIKTRQIERGDEPEEAKRRFIADKLDFADIDGLVDYTINNENRSVELVAKEIDKIYRGTLHE